MNFYELDRELEACFEMVDEETGEWIGYDRFEELQVEREKKLEGIALWIKEIEAECKAIREEEKRLADRRTKGTAKAERLKAFLEDKLSGETLKTARCVVSYRKSPVRVEISDMDALVDWCFKNGHGDVIEYAHPTISKTAIKPILMAGELVNGAEVIEGTMTMNIK